MDAAALETKESLVVELQALEGQLRNLRSLIGEAESAAPQFPSNGAPTSPTGLQNILRRPQVEKVTGLSRSQIYLLMSRGKFPLPIPLDGDGGRAVGWLENEILDHQEARIEERKSLGGVPGGMRRDAKSAKGATEVS